MDLIETLRTTGAIREFTDEPVPDEVVARLLETARFAPSGGNRQGWRVVLVKDPDVRRQVRDLYLMGWYDYLAMMLAGLTPWAPVTDRAAEAEALVEAPKLAAQAAVSEEAGRRGFAEHVDEVPVLLVLWADLKALAAVDRDLDRYTFAGGASIYPFAWNLLLAARSEGLGGVITTMPIGQEAAMRELFGAPDHYAVAGVIALGHPVHQPTRLQRAAVASFTTVDRVDGTPFPS
ncbi:MAG TPA: nitroreductase family protein [Acidimicrobiales bacterium]|nr:nitroreductase family protein [Acidimicrobiales bacterium]